MFVLKFCRLRFNESIIGGIVYLLFYVDVFVIDWFLLYMVVVDFNFIGNLNLFIFLLRMVIN